jgi:hypothetical protein
MNIPAHNKWYFLKTCLDIIGETMLNQLRLITKPKTFATRH